MAIIFSGSASEAYQLVPLPVAQWCDAVCDDLEDDPGQAHLREHRYQRHPGEWLLKRYIAGREWWLVWRREGDDVVIRHLGELANT